MTGVVRDGYTLEGKVENFENPQMCKVMALLGGSSGFSTGLFNLIRDENIGTCFLLGYQYINMHAMGEMCKAAGVYSVVGHPNVHVNLPLCITSFDYAILINEYYAVGAFLGKDPIQLGSVRGMDIITYGTALALIITPLLYLISG